MPSTSEKQKKFMRAAAHDLKFAEKAGIKQSVAQEFEAADETKATPRDKKISKMYKKK